MGDVLDWVDLRGERQGEIMDGHQIPTFSPLPTAMTRRELRSVPSPISAKEALGIQQSPVRRQAVRRD